VSVTKAKFPDFQEHAGHFYRFHAIISAVFQLIPFMKWIRGNISPEQLVLHAEHPGVIFDAVKSGLGIGMIAEHDAESIDDLVQIAPPQEEWMSNLWIVTHVDLHRSLKVQEFLKFLKVSDPNFETVM